MAERFRQSLNRSDVAGSNPDLGILIRVPKRLEIGVHVCLANYVCCNKCALFTGSIMPIYWANTESFIHGVQIACELQSDVDSWPSGLSRRLTAVTSRVQILAWAY